MILSENLDRFGIPTLEEDFKSSAKKFAAQGVEQAEIDEYFAEFKSLKDGSKIKEPSQKDIDVWAKGSWDDFKKFVDSIKTTTTKTQAKKQAKGEGAELVAQNDKWLVYRITSHNACMSYGSGTQWCITSKESGMWDKYIKRNNFYFIISKEPRTDDWNKIAVQVNASGKNMYWDERDVEHDKLPRGLGVPPFVKEQAVVKVEFDGRVMTPSEFQAAKNLKVEGDLYLGGTSVASLPDGLKVSGRLDLSGTNITSLPDGLEVGGAIVLSDTNITSLPEGLKVSGMLDLRDTPITSLPAGLEVGGSLYLTGTKITSLPAGLKVGNLYLTGTKITSLPEGLKVGGTIYVDDPKKITAPESLKEKLK